MKSACGKLIISSAVADFTQKTEDKMMPNNNMFSAFYEAVKKIPKGKVMNYGAVAALAGYPGCSRQVGFALHANPDPKNIPCHRVVFKDGSLSPAFAFGGENMQRKMLAEEGVGFVGDKVDMKTHGVFAMDN